MFGWSDYSEKSRAAAADPASAHRVIRGGSWAQRRAARARGVPGPLRALGPEPRPGLSLCRVQARVVSGESRGSAAERVRSTPETATRRAQRGVRQGRALQG